MPESPVPARPKVYHIVHVDRLPSIVSDGGLSCDAEMMRRPKVGTPIGMGQIKARRASTTLDSHPDLHVGDCVPFYFCPQSVMLYLLYRSNHPELTYRGGQALIVHLEADLLRAVRWANQAGRRWAFTASNAGSSYFEDWCDLSDLQRIDWSAVAARDWQRKKEGKQAEFLMELSCPWFLIDRVGVHSAAIQRRALAALDGAEHRPRVEVRSDWYYGRNERRRV